MGKRQKTKIKGTSLKPRLSVFRSNKHIYAQVIDDSCSKTIIACSTVEKEIQSQLSSTSTQLASKLVGEILGKRLLEIQISQIVFDRGKKPYHGRIKALAEGIRLTGSNIINF
uniref:Large ribosomal subunit protein uL18c n=1 Tax=Schizocladia ischiensis TaxID=196139 RepID=A0A7S6ZPB2_9STRA|nr:ribosomal protein L18 [Schizocladia ischiensis]QOW07549.1 ribosomal protein L18 [Schizocladia ischiensis]